MNSERKIIHVDMDCFYAAIEQRENPALMGKPIAVGGGSRRGVICTASYEARAFGCHSAMPGFKALELCPQLIIVPVRFDLYKQASSKIRAIFGRFTELIEPLSLDEAYLDVSHWKSDPVAIAREIRAQIYEETRLTASAGISSNKLIAKIASDWQKPNGQHQIPSDEIPAFMKNLPVAKLWGVGKKMQQKLTSAGIQTCGDMQQVDKLNMAKNHGKWGLELYDLCRGIDTREVQSSRIRKSISKENTFGENVARVQDLFPSLIELLDSVRESHEDRYRDRMIKAIVVKLKFADFTQTTIERATDKPSIELARELLIEGWRRGGQKSVRLLGVGIKLADPEPQSQPQLELGME
ncbi:MAG: DNA polymerase IV [Rubritalea sp.]